jgi:hypothetical protein
MIVLATKLSGEVFRMSCKKNAVNEGRFSYSDSYLLIFL